MMTTLIVRPHISATPGMPHDRRPKVEAYVFEVEGMGKGERMGVEKQMLLLPEGEPGEVWYTRWRRAPDGTYSCRERIVGAPEQVAEFAAAVEELAERGGFMARVSKRTYPGAHV